MALTWTTEWDLTAYGSKILILLMGDGILTASSPILRHGSRMDSRRIGVKSTWNKAPTLHSLSLRYVRQILILLFIG